MTARDRDLLDAGLIGKPAFRPDPSDAARRQRDFDREVLGPLRLLLRAFLWLVRGARAAFVATFPTRWERVGAVVMALAFLWFVGFVLPQVGNVPERVRVEATR